jgi:hypothetical protein
VEVGSSVVGIGSSTVVETSRETAVVVVSGSAVADTETSSDADAVVASGAEVCSSSVAMLTVVDVLEMLSTVVTA